MSIMQMAGHADFKTTERYIDLAGVVFADQVRLQSDWYAGGGTKKRYEMSVVPAETGSVSGFEPSHD